MTILEHMDRLVYASRLDRIIFMQLEPRTFRWTPLLVIAVMITGYALMARAGSAFVPNFWIGWLLFYGGILAGGLLSTFGPRLSATAIRPLDERELVVKARAHATSGVVLATATMFGCFYMASAGVPWLWHPQGYDWINLGFGLQGLVKLLPTWIASWLEPQPVASFED